MKQFTLLALVFLHLAIFDILTTWFGLFVGLVEVNPILVNLGVSSPFAWGPETTLAYIFWFTADFLVRCWCILTLWLAHRFFSKHHSKIGIWIVYGVAIGLIAYNIYIVLSNIYFLYMFFVPHPEND